MRETETSVFVVDDDDAVRDSLKVLLEVEGFVVCAFASGEEFFALIDPRGLDHGCCMLLDLHMPGMSGFDVLARLVELDAPIPVVLLTADADEARVRRLLEVRVKAVLPKPAEYEALLSAIHGALRGGGLDGSDEASR